MALNRVYMLVFAVLWSLQAVCPLRPLVGAQDVDLQEQSPVLDCPVLDLMPEHLMKYLLQHHDRDVIKGEKDLSPDLDHSSLKPERKLWFSSSKTSYVPRDIGIFRKQAVVESSSSVVDADYKLNPRSIVCKDDKERTIPGASANSMARWFLSTSRPPRRNFFKSPWFATSSSPSNADQGSQPGQEDTPNPSRPGPGSGWSGNLTDTISPIKLCCS